MANIEVRKDSQFVKVLAAQARGERLDSKITAEANQIVTDLVSDFSPANRHMFAQTVGYGVDELQQHSLDFLGNVADIKHAGWNEKVAFNIQTRGIMAQINAKGATPSRSYVTEKQVSVDTFEITSRPTIAIGDLLQGRVQMPKLIKEASDAFEREQVTYVQSVLQAGISAYSSPFYATGTGVVANTLDQQIDYFMDYGPVAILGAHSALRKVSGLAGAVLDPTVKSYSDEMKNEANANGHLGVYNGAELICMANAFYPGTTTPILNRNWLYILPGGYTGDARNLKVVFEGNVRSYERQDPDDEALEVTLKQWFGASFITMDRLPNVGAYLIG